MRVLNVVSVISAREGGGNGERTVQLSKALAETGAECIVLTLGIGNPATRISHLGGAKLALVSCLNSRFQLPLGGWRLIQDLVRQTDVIHLMGYWSILGVMVSVAARRAGVPYVVSPAGALPLFGRSRWLKRIFNRIVGRQLISKASGWIAITKAECADFMPYGIPPGEIEVLPNGVNEADFAVNGPSKSDDRKVSSGTLILFMGRLNLIKGPDLLLEAFAQVAAEFPDTKLVFAGPDEGLGDTLAQEAEMHGLRDRVHFLGFVSGIDKSLAYRSASLLVVPSRHEAMSIVAVEGGICGTPVLMTNQCGLDELAEIDPGLVVPATAEGLAHGLRMALSDRQQLEEWGRRWETMVRERYSWTDLTLKLRGYLQKIVAKERLK
ncbi:MAG: glycosyltransferase [Rhodocyclaceae bacterium]|nr:glycosyltransferase [Rhodocyclaceae bacterium]MDZ4214822.1 glycosyltransferase [Rhodocyclaceae bacterium]